MAGRKALIAGATGLVGNELLQILLQATEYEKVYAIVRRPVGLSNPKLIEVVCDFERLDDFRESFSVDDVFCCLGTTIKKAKTKAAMYRVDVEYPLEMARLAKEQGARHYLLVSSMGANPKSSVFYSRMKGQLEEQLKEIPYEAISIMRPSLLLGNRQEFRLGEKVAVKVVRGLSFLLSSSMRSRIAIEARDVAMGMYKLAQGNERGVRVYSSGEIGELVKGKANSKNNFPLS